MHRLWTNAKRRAEQTGVPFTLTEEDVRAVWPSDDRCPALGVLLRPNEGASGDDSPSLDRLNPAWGYEPGNIAVLSQRANRIKSNATAREMQQIAAWMKACGLA